MIGRLLLLQIRRDRIQLPVWLMTTGLLAYTSAAGVLAEFPTDAERADVLRLAVATPALLALRGVPDGASAGSYVFFQVFTYLALMAAFMSTFFVTRHSRADEESGRAELLGASAIRRSWPLMATVALGLAADAALAMIVAGAFVLGGLDAGGSILAGAATGAVGAAFLGVATVVAQLAPSSRAANGAASAVVGGAFLLRAVGDALGTRSGDGLSVVSAWPSWVSPIGWGQQVFAFTKQDPLPLFLLGALAAVTAGLAIALRSRRDLGSSLVPERRGREHARATFRSSLALSWRLHGPSVLGWAIGGAGLGVLAGSLSGAVADSLAGNETIAELLRALAPGGEGAIVDLFIASVIGFAGVLAAAAGAQAVMRARNEETDGRSELVLSAPVRRGTWLLEWVLVAVAAAVAVSLAAGVAAGLTFLAAGEDDDRFWSSVEAGVAQIPAAMVYVAVATVLLIVLPRLTVGVGWALVGLGFVLGQMGALLRLPDWVRDASPFTHTPSVPAADVDWSGAVAMVIVSLALIAAGALLARRRELTP